MRGGKMWQLSEALEGAEQESPAPHWWHKMCKCRSIGANVVAWNSPGRGEAEAMSMKHFLQRRHVPFEVISHPQAFDAQHLAHALHAPGGEVAKTVLLRIDHGNRYVVAVLPSTHMVDLRKLSDCMGGATIELATEHEIAQRCPDCEFGVLPPFGAHYGAETIVDASLARDDHISFESDSFREAIRMKYADFQSYEQPLVVDFSCRPQASR